MKKVFVVVLVGLLAVFTVFEVSSEAKVMKFEHFSIDVPDGWRVEEDKEKFTTAFYAPGDSAALTIAVFENEGTPLEEIAKMLMNELDGSDLEKSGDAYVFRFKSDGTACRAAVSGKEMIVFMTVIGEHDDILRMIESLDEGSSEARTMEFEHFSIEVPSGWRVEEDKQNFTVTFVAPGESAGLTVSVFESGGQPLEKIAEMLMTQLDGNNLEKSEDTYTFQFKNEGLDCHGIVASDEKRVMFVSIIGTHDDFLKMINSLKEK